MDLQTLLNSKVGTGLGAALPRLMPAAVGHRLAAVAGDVLAGRQGSSLVRAVAANQAVVCAAQGKEVSSAELQRCVRSVLRSRTRCLFDLFHNLDRPAALERLAPLPPELMAIVELSRQGKRGAVIAMAHMSAYEMAMIAMGHRGIRALLLGYSQPAAGYQRYYRMWEAAGLEVAPATLSGLRQASNCLKQAGLVVTGIDRPTPGRTLSFFGRPSQLPTGHITLALAADVPILPAVTHWQGGDRYEVIVADPVEMQRLPDHRETIRVNAEAVLAQIERFVRRAPEQWFMFYPVWPGALADIDSLSMG